MMKLLITIALLIFPLSSFAEDVETLWLTTGEWSSHYEQDNHHYRQNNTGIGIQYYIQPDTSIVVGYYNNSIYHESVYAGMTYTPFNIKAARFGVMGAMVTGYNIHYPMTPIGSIYGEYEYKGVGVNVAWLPYVVIAVQLKVRLF